MITVFNPKQGPITYDTAGHVVPALEHVLADPTDPVTAALLAAGTLVGEVPTMRSSAAKPKPAVADK